MTYRNNMEQKREEKRKKNKEGKETSSYASLLDSSPFFVE
jgi:hypothetical protein